MPPRKKVESSPSPGEDITNTDQEVTSTQQTPRETPESLPTSPTPSTTPTPPQKVLGTGIK